MNKPITVARSDYISAIVNASNNSGLPAFVMVDALENLLTQLRKLSDREYRRDNELYQQALKREGEAAQDADRTA